MFVIILVVSGTTSATAQLDATAFETFSQTFANPYLINPAATDTSYGFNARACNISQLGLVRNVNRFYIDADKRWGTPQKDDGIHHAGIQMTNSTLGDYISKSGLQVRYSWYTQLSRKLYMSAGASLGFVNYAFMTTQGGTGGSDYGPDGSVGVHFTRENTTVGFALQQIFPTILIPVNQSFRFDRLYNVDFTHKFRLSHQTDLSAFFVTQVSETGFYNYSFGCFADFWGYGRIGVNNFSLFKTSANLGLTQLRVSDMKLEIMATYNVYHSAIALPDNSLEIFLSIKK